MKRLSRSLAAALVLALLAGCGQAQPGTDVNGSSSSVGQPNPSVSESSDGSTGGQTVPVLMGGAVTPMLKTNRWASSPAASPTTTSRRTIPTAPTSIRM